MEQPILSDFDKRQGDFARVRALIMKVVSAEPGLSRAGVEFRFITKYAFKPLVDNRLRELVGLGWVEARKQEDGLLHYYAVESEGA